jgi:hypothetical protein
VEEKRKPIAQQRFVEIARLGIYQKKPLRDGNKKKIY